ncbi:MAG TPA: AAA family ATPase, partial [Candidatus Deferrimicrobium sp.]|nr:AAA family ATPase [Candidatus Deferrimicrobium sp.]
MTTRHHALFGRSREVRIVHSLLDEVLTGRGRVLRIGGEPGIGKTRLAEEIAESARDRRFAVAWGRSLEEGGAPPFWPWIQALRSFLRGADTRALSARIGMGREHLLRLLPELGATDDNRARDDDSARFQLFDAIVRLLGLLSEKQPLAILLDDIHTADDASLRLLRFTAVSMVDLPVLLVVTYRDTEVATRGVPGDVLGSLLRAPATHAIGLDGLDAGEVFDLMASLAEAAPSRASAQAIFDRTSGNPLLVTELVRLGGPLSAEAAATDALPTVTRQVI